MTGNVASEAFDHMDGEFDRVLGYRDQLKYDEDMLSDFSGYSSDQLTTLNTESDEEGSSGGESSMSKRDRLIERRMSQQYGIEVPYKQTAVNEAEKGETMEEVDETGQDNKRMREQDNEEREKPLIVDEGLLDFSKDMDNICVEELIQFQDFYDYHIDFQHIGVLWVLDSRKRGIFDREDLFNFVELVNQNDDFGVENEFQWRFQSFCTVKLWYDVEVEEQEGFDEWLTKVVTAPFKIREYRDYPNVRFVSSDALRLLHRILDIGTTSYGFQEFLDLAQQTAEEKNMQKLEDEYLDDVIPVDIIRVFSENFLTGMCSLMKEIGYSKDNKNLQLMMSMTKVW
eukprot:TRINITY_DN91_c0_g5_i2.p1 TRINITY_DN91_c0_g5~~TRINITY_DN91_c0_g5_i2.p1  ORF type:complete len:341 (-),score=107.03 TRINITY_DN91_c0_g5_i2:472-1494(-)